MYTTALKIATNEHRGLHKAAKQTVAGRLHILTTYRLQ